MKRYNNRYIDGRCLKQYYCKDCGKKISYNSGFCGKGRCNFCAMKYLFTNPKNHGSYKNGNYTKQYCCKLCENRISQNSYVKGLGLCRSCSKKGKLNGSYIDGKGYHSYNSDFTYKLKNKIRKRDNYICQLCEKSGKDVHHIDYNKFNCKVNFNKDYYYAYFKYIISEREQLNAR